MEIHHGVACGSLGWGDGDTSSPEQLGGLLGSCRALNWEIQHPAWALGQMEHPETWPGQTLPFPFFMPQFPPLQEREEGPMSAGSCKTRSW